MRLFLPQTLIMLADNLVHILYPAAKRDLRQGDGYRPFRQRTGADHSGHSGHPHDHHLQGLWVGWSGGVWSPHFSTNEKPRP